MEFSNPLAELFKYHVEFDANHEYCRKATTAYTHEHFVC